VKSQQDVHLHGHGSDEIEINQKFSLFNNQKRKENRLSMIRSQLNGKLPLRRGGPPLPPSSRIPPPHSSKQALRKPTNSRPPQQASNKCFNYINRSHANLTSSKKKSLTYDNGSSKENNPRYSNKAVVSIRNTSNHLTETSFAKQSSQSSLKR